MPIDPNIPLQVQQLKLESPTNQLAMMGEAMKIGEMQRGVGVQNELRNLYSQGIDVSTPEGFRQLASVDPATAMKLRTDALKAQELQGNIKKTGLDITAKDIEIQREKLGNLAFNTSDNNVKAHLEDSVLQGKLTPQAAQQQWAQVAPLNSEQRKQYFTEMGVKTEERYKMNKISAAQQQTADIQQGQLDVSRGNLKIAKENQQRGTIPSGYRMSADGKNLEAIPGGPTTVPLAPKERQAREAKYPMANQAVKTVESKADTLITDLETLKNHPGLDSITGAVYGRTPSVTSEGRSAQALYDSILARGGFQELRDMRAASPTGGALGNISNQEGQQLKDAFGTLNRTQDAADLRKQLGRVADDVRGAKTRIREAFDETYDYKASSGAPALPPGFTPDK
jgi:hypothetical protein